jgi:hypothetical protein
VGERAWNEAVAVNRPVDDVRRGNAAVAVRERVENTGSPPIRASAGIWGGYGGGASHRKDVDTPSLVGSCRGTLRAP